MDEGVKPVFKMVKPYCPNCGRNTGETRLNRVEGQLCIYEITAPWCDGINDFGGLHKKNCRQLTEDELSMPSVIQRWTEIDWNVIDLGIIPMLKEAHSMGLRTCFSCDGHGKRGYIMFYTPAEAQKYYDVLDARATENQKVNGLELVIRWHPYLPKAGTIRFPPSMVNWTPREPGRGR